jgi:hypothetical protein
VSTHTSSVRLLPPSRVASTSKWLLCLMVELHASKVEPQVASVSAPKLLQMLLAVWVPSLCQASWSGKSASTCQHCQMQAHAGHKTARIGFRLSNTIFWLSRWKSDRDQVVGNDWLQSLHHGRNTTPLRDEVVSLCGVKLAEMTLETNLYELTVPFECYILETE